MVPSGDISDMPQACTTVTPKSRSNDSIIAGGQAEPPMTVSLKVENLRPFDLTWFSRPIHTVGTPALIVTPSSSNSRCRLAPSSAAPGITSLAPAAAQTYGSPQALT